jgi:hypothetical protein
LDLILEDGGSDNFYMLLLFVLKKYKRLNSNTPRRTAAPNFLSPTKVIQFCGFRFGTVINLVTASAQSAFQFTQQETATVNLPDRFLLKPITKPEDSSQPKS